MQTGRCINRFASPTISVALCALAWLAAAQGEENWPRWRGPDGNGVSEGSPLPVTWGTEHNVRWKASIPGEGASSPIVWHDRVFLTSALEQGTRRAVHCLDRVTGRTVWSREITDENPELTSALTGHAASTPVTDGAHVVAFFGNAGAVCYDYAGRLVWRRRFGEFDAELGLASSPILDHDRVILLCDHDGTSFRTFDSFLIALDLRTGGTRWKTDRPGLYRSWSTPILVPVPDKGHELIVNAQDELRAYNPETGKPLWRLPGMTKWVTPSPVFGHGLVFAASGKDGPTLAVTPGGMGDVTESNLRWRVRRGSPYVCSPLMYGAFLYVHDENGMLTCRETSTGKQVYRQRLEGKFIASGIAGDGKLFLTNDAGDTFVIKAGASYELLAKNSLNEEVLASPAVFRGELFLRTATRLYCIHRADEP